MKMKTIFTVVSLFAFVLLGDCFALDNADKEGEGSIVQLPAINTSGGMPLMQALGLRKSQREFSQKELPLQVLADLAWAACGVNRPQEKLHTAPTARNFQEIELYMARKDGVFLYDPLRNCLIKILSEDIRGLTGKQEFVKQAPVNLIFVSDFSKMARLSPEDQLFYSAADTGFSSQNVYLFCASQGLATVVRGYIDKPALETAMKLSSDKKVILCQSVGYPAAQGKEK